MFRGTYSTFCARSGYVTASELPGFFGYLTSERGLRPASVAGYQHHLDRFEAWQVIDVDVAADRQITFGRNLAEGLGERLDDIQGGIEASSDSVAKSLKSLASPEGWRLGEVSASFGITLTAEAGVIVSKASAGATFEVSVTFTRDP